MALFGKDEPLTAATVQSFDRIPNRPTVDAIRDGDLWHIYRCVPEVHYAVNQQARLVGRLDWRVESEGAEMKEGEEILRQAFGSDLRSIAVMAAIHLQVVGRFWLVRYPGPRGLKWKILNSPLSSNEKKIAEAATVLVEVVIDDPAIEGRADSAVGSIRDIATELILTRAQARGAARSRTAQTNLVLYPKEGAGANPKKFEDELAKVIAEPLSDEKASSVAVPNMIGFPQEYIAGWKVIDLSGPIDEKLHDRIERLIKQLAIGLDIAPSILLGLEDSNQWSAYASLEDNWLGHVEPLAAPVGQALAEGMTKAAKIDRNSIEVVPDPAPLLRRRPANADIIQAAQLGIVTFAWAAEQLGAPDDAVGEPMPEEDAPPTAEDEIEEPALEQRETREITAGPTDPNTAAHTPGHTIDGARLADIDDQVYTSLEDLILDIAERALEKIGARIRSMAQGRNMDLPTSVPNAELARQFTGDVPNAQAVIDQVATENTAKVTRVIERAQGRLRAMGIEVPPEPEQEGLTAAQAAFVAAVAATVTAQQQGGTGLAQAWEAARQVATIAGGGEPSDFQSAASGIALAASTMATIRRDFGLAPPPGDDAYRWLHLYQGPDPHPVHLSLKDALFDGVSVFAGGFVAFPGDHPGCQCIAAPADLVSVRTGWSQIQPTAQPRGA